MKNIYVLSVVIDEEWSSSSFDFGCVENESRGKKIVSALKIEYRKLQKDNSIETDAKAESFEKFQKYLGIQDIVEYQEDGMKFYCDSLPLIGTLKDKLDGVLNDDSTT